MRLEKITIAQNGFVLEDAYGNLHVAKTLAEAAQIAGESIPASGYTNYSVGFSAEDLSTVKRYMRDGQKINAIKLLRDCFAPRLGLREAKELAEILCA